MKELKKINLQLFAEPNTNVTTDAGLSVENKTHYDMTLIDEAAPLLVHDQFGQKRPIPKNGGKKIEFRKYASFPKAMQPLTEGVTPDGRKLSVTAIEAEVKQYGDYVTLSDVLDLTAIDPNVVEATKACGRQAGLTGDTVTRNVLQSGTNVYYVGGGESRVNLTAENQLTVSDVRKIATILKSMNAPKIDGSYVAIIHPFVSCDLRSDPAFIDVAKYADASRIFEGEIGKVEGVRFVETSEAAIFNEDAITGIKINKAEGYKGVITSVTFDGAAIEESALVGKAVRINGKGAVITANTASTITFEGTDFGEIANDEDVEIAASVGGAVFSTLFIADGAYGVTEVTGGGLQTIIKQLGSAGTADPLNQRSSVGWKFIKTAEILVEAYMVRAESCSEFSAEAKAN